MPSQRQYFSAVVSIPDLGHLIIPSTWIKVLTSRRKAHRPAARDDTMAVRRERYGSDPRAVALQDTQFLSAGSVPQPCGLIVTARNNSCSIRREADREYCGVVSSERVQIGAIGRIPHLGSVILTPSDYEPA